MRKNVYLFILLFCTMFLFACSNSEEASIMKIQNILLTPNLHSDSQTCIT